jgi:LPS export ABC transporter protein LptC
MDRPMNDFGKKTPFKRPKTLRWVLAGVIFATFIAVVATFIGYRRMAVDFENEAEMLRQSKADIALQQVRHTATRDGRDEWTLTAKSARVMGKQNRTVIDRPSVVFFMKDGKKVFLNAEKGVLIPDTNDLEAVGNVEVTYEVYVLKTERLRYDHQKRRIYTRVPVTLEGNRLFLMADSMIYDLDSQTSTFKGNVESKIHDTFVL